MEPTRRACQIVKGSWWTHSILYCRLASEAVMAVAMPSVSLTHRCRNLTSSSNACAVLLAICGARQPAQGHSTSLPSWRAKSWHSHPRNQDENVPIGSVNSLSAADLRQKEGSDALAKNTAA